jgi:capsular polysaccharide biosynthesis protein
MTKGEYKMKRYLVSPELKPYLRRIMDRRSLDYNFQCADGKDYCNIYMSSNSFHKLIKRAACEKRSKEEGITFVTEEESSNPIRCAARQLLGYRITEHAEMYGSVICST